MHLGTAAALQDALTLADVMLTLVTALHQRQRLQTLHRDTHGRRVSDRIPASLTKVVVCKVSPLPWGIHTLTHRCCVSASPFPWGIHTLTY